MCGFTINIIWGCKSLIIVHFGEDPFVSYCNDKLAHQQKLLLAAKGYTVYFKWRGNQNTDIFRGRQDEVFQGSRAGGKSDLEREIQ